MILYFYNNSRSKTNNIQKFLQNVKVVNKNKFIIHEKFKNEVSLQEQPDQLR